MSDYEQKDVRCSFCGKDSSQVKRIIAGPNAYICNECVDLCKEIISQETDSQGSFSGDVELSTPKEIKEFLDSYVIGQDDAKKTLSVAVYNLSLIHI